MSNGRAVRIGDVEYAYSVFSVYTHDRFVLNAGLSSVQSIQIDKDADFEVQALGYFADVAAAAMQDSTRVLPLVSLNITDGQSQRTLFRKPVALPAIAGYQGLPFILPQRFLYVANSVIELTYTSFVAAGTNYGLQLALIGRKLYQPRAVAA